MYLPAVGGVLPEPCPFGPTALLSHDSHRRAKVALAAAERAGGM